MAAIPHPNATVGGLGGGAGLGTAVLVLLGDAGVHLSSKQSGLVAGGCAFAVLFLASPVKYVLKYGLAGAWHRLIHGSGGLTP